MRSSLNKILLQTALFTRRYSVTGGFLYMYGPSSGRDPVQHTHTQQMLLLLPPSSSMSSRLAGGSPESVWMYLKLLYWDVCNTNMGMTVVDITSHSNLSSKEAKDSPPHHPAVILMREGASPVPREGSATARM